jgi:phosphoserine phosphatase
MDYASRRLATRRASVSIEQETERLWFWRLIKLEVERARRRDHAFSVVCIRNLDAPVVAEVARQLRPQLRDTDAVLAEEDRVLILLSDTCGEAVRHAARRLPLHCNMLHEQAYWQEVAFPRDALTLRALIECLHRADTGERLPLAG